MRAALRLILSLLGNNTSSLEHGHLLIRRCHIVAPCLLQLLMRPVVIPELLFPREVNGDRSCALGEHGGHKQRISYKVLPFYCPTGSVLRELVPQGSHWRSTILLLLIEKCVQRGRRLYLDLIASLIN